MARALELGRDSHIKKMGTFTLKLTEIYLSFIFQQHGNKLKPLKRVQFTRGFTKVNE
jgi:hypothetical protein